MTSCVVIAAAGLDWSGLGAAMATGGTPNLADLSRRGWAAWLAGAPLGDGPAAWANLATGLEPEAHGVWRGEEAWAGGVRPAGRASWRTAPLWERLTAAGIRTGVAGWPATTPGADWKSLVIDDDFAFARGRSPETWAMPLRCAREAAREALRQVRVHPTDITAAMLAPFVPAIASLDQSRDALLPALAVAMAKAATIQAAGRWLANAGEVDALFIHHSWMGDVRNTFETHDRDPFAGVIPAAWRFLDGLVGAIRIWAGPEADMVIVSPGWRGRLGVVVAAGPSVGQPIAGGRLVDLAPSILARFDLENRPQARWLGPSKGARRALAPAPAPASAAPADDALLSEAMAAGYSRPSPPSAAWFATGQAMLGFGLIDRDRVAAAQAAKAALDLDPDNVLALRVLVRVAFLEEQAEPLLNLGTRLTELAPGQPWGALAFGAYHVVRGEKGLAGPWLRRVEAGADRFTLATAAVLWSAAGRWSDAERLFRRLRAGDPGDVTAAIGLAMALKARRDFIGAEAALAEAAQADPSRAAVWLQFADLYARTARKIEAERAVSAARRLEADETLVADAIAGRLGAQDRRAV